MPQHQNHVASTILTGRQVAGSVSNPSLLESLSRHGMYAASKNPTTSPPETASEQRK